LVQCVTHTTAVAWGGTDRDTHEAFLPFTFVRPADASVWTENQVFKGERPWRLTGDGSSWSHTAFVCELHAKRARLQAEVKRAEEEVQMVKQDMHSALMWFQAHSDALTDAVQRCKTEVASLKAQTLVERDALREKQGLVMLFTLRRARVMKLGQDAARAFYPILGFGPADSIMTDATSDEQLRSIETDSEAGSSDAEED
jgi:hypothetical protein